MKKILIIFILFLLFFSFTKRVYAIYDPTSMPNNNFGIHIADTNDIKDAESLVNSTGGDWGYITLVIQKGERDTSRWQAVFDKMRRLHLIPIVRIASAPIPGNDSIWEKLNINEIDGWVSFLNSLNWVIKNRYVVIGNEPNHAKEWGGEINPKEYTTYLKTFSQKLKNSNEDFFIIPAGFDAAANTQNGKDPTMEEGLYLQKVLDNDTNIFEFIDGWASHSYPTGNFGIKAYDWELNYLKFLGVKKNLPVFITETGWAHKTDTLETNLGKNYEEAFKNIWNDKRIIAITPFVYKYITPPFDNFSWVGKDGKFYDFYNAVLNMPKQKGEPIQEVRGNILTGILPKIATVGSSYHALLFIKNEGQSIWGINDLSAIDIYGNKLEIAGMFPLNVEPNEIGAFLITGNFPNESGNKTYTITLTSKGKIITNSFSQEVNIIPSLPNPQEIIDYLRAVGFRKIESLLAKLKWN